MRLNLLLVNPWIYDFAAFNLWALPLGLFNVAEYLTSFDTHLSFIDCTASFTPGDFGTGKYSSEVVEKPKLLESVPRVFKRYGIGVDEFVRKLKCSLPVDAVLITSAMSYWYPGVKKAIDITRDIAGDVPVVLGGIYSTLYHEHAVNSTGADFIFKGPLSESLGIAFDTFGFRLMRKKTGTPYYKLPFCTDSPFAAIRTSAGCPFRCSYCASALLSGTGYSRRSPDDVSMEIAELYGRGIRDYAIYDDAFLYDAGHHAKPLLRTIVRAGLQVRFHTPNGLHARFVDDEIARLMKDANFKTVRLSLETTDPQRQGDTGGKVNNDDLARAVELLKRNGFSKKELGVYLMYGLPGQEMSEVVRGVDFLKSLGVRIYLTEFSPVKGTRSWDELVLNGVIEDTLDPLLTNNSVFSFLYSGYDDNEVRALKLAVKAHNEELH